MPIDQDIARQIHEGIERAKKDDPINWFADVRFTRPSGNSKQRRKTKRAMKRARVLPGVTFRVPIRQYTFTLAI